MACISIPTENMESEREEGEIVDDLDDLSDISSEEEYLLRQRLEILENYNNVLERKEAKRSSTRSGKSKTNFLWPDFSVLHGKDRASQPQIYRVIRNDRHLKKPKRPKEIEKDVVPIKINRKKYSRTKKTQTLNIVSESSEDSNDEEYKNKRQKLADAVTLNTNKVDSTSLKDRLARMLYPKQKSNESNVIVNTILTGSTSMPKNNNKNNIKSDTHSKILNQNPTHTSLTTEPSSNNNIKLDTQLLKVNQNNDDAEIKVIDLINMSTDDDVKIVTDNDESQDNVDGINKHEIQKGNSGETTDEDIESLRQHALKTKSSKQNRVLPDTENIEVNKVESEDEDSDTEELRMICLRSALIKKAIEMKKKQKLQKRLSHNSIIHDDLLEKYENNGNSTDVENVDMDIGSDVDDKEKDNVPIIEDNNDFNDKQEKENKVAIKLSKEDELEEDEDLLRAKLLTSLSKNLPIFVDINTVNNAAVHTEEAIKPKKETVTKVSLPEKKFIIELGDSDSEGEHEATKNLTKMHMKLSEQTEFQQKLDQFLKSTRMQVESNTLPDVVQSQASTKPPQKFVPKAMNHLPKSEQIEYKKLVKRMAELEKIKQARQLTLNNLKKPGATDMLKPRNISPNELAVSSKKLEEKIATSRKVIAQESAKMLKLKEEATKLSQRYKIVSNELRNITTAITLNKKQQRTVQNGLTKIRLQHQLLLKSSTINHSSLPSPPVNTPSNKVLHSNNKKQKENEPLMKEHKNTSMLKSVKVSVVNDLNKDLGLNNPKLAIEVDVCNNKKVVKIPKTPTKERVVNFNESQNRVSETNRSIEKDGGDKNDRDDERDKKYDVNDYISPLEALGRTERTRNLRNNPMTDTVDGICVRTSRYMGAAIWKEDPNAFLCPFEVGGSCRDTDCKYLHLQTQ